MRPQLPSDFKYGTKIGIKDKTFYCNTCECEIPFGLIELMKHDSHDVVQIIDVEHQEVK